MLTYVWPVTESRGVKIYYNSIKFLFLFTNLILSSDLLIPCPLNRAHVFEEYSMLYLQDPYLNFEPVFFG